ncbi:hypothetical protein C8J56DRAFT_923280 [Mycena floridula]|nr:hypothetical protein C8J56DRAFT_923280 [Mycena floridula]
MRSCPISGPPFSLYSDFLPISKWSCTISVPPLFNKLRSFTNTYSILLFLSFLIIFLSRCRALTSTASSFPSHQSVAMPADALSQAQPHLRRPPSCHHSVVTALWRQHPFSLTHSLLQFREGCILFGYVPFLSFDTPSISSPSIQLGFSPLV